MTDQTQQKPKFDIIPKPVQRAIYAGLIGGGCSVVFGVPTEFAPRIALVGACYSLAISWRELGKPGSKRRRGRQVLVNGQAMSLEYSLGQPGYIARETWGERVTRWVYGRGETPAVSRPARSVLRPAEVDEFTFFCRGIQLRESHVKLFLRSAWHNRQYGKGLSARRWVREFSQRPAWYKELSPAWFYAMRQLLFDAQTGLGLQLVTLDANNWLSLANEPFTTLSLLKWYEKGGDA